MVRSILLYLFYGLGKITLSLWHCEKNFFAGYVVEFVVRCEFVVNDWLSTLAARVFGLRPKMCRPSANTKNSRLTREKPLVPKILGQLLSTSNITVVLYICLQCQILKKYQQRSKDRKIGLKRYEIYVINLETLVCSVINFQKTTSYISEC